MDIPNICVNCFSEKITKWTCPIWGHIEGNTAKIYAHNSKNSTVYSYSGETSKKGQAIRF